jgi:hypothetical protein
MVKQPKRSEFFGKAISQRAIDRSTTVQASKPKDPLTLIAMMSAFSK